MNIPNPPTHTHTHTNINMYTSLQNDNSNRTRNTIHLYIHIIHTYCKVSLVLVLLVCVCLCVYSRVVHAEVEYSSSYITIQHNNCWTKWLLCYFLHWRLLPSRNVYIPMFSWFLYWIVAETFPLPSRPRRTSVDLQIQRYYIYMEYIYKRLEIK